jgi:acetyltransferase-like isoleucine patch superfamily enzyme
MQLGARSVSYLLRKICYKFLFTEIGRGVTFGQNVIIRHPHKMKIGSNVMIDDNCVLDAKGCQKGDFVINNNVILSRGCILSAKYGSLQLAKIRILAQIVWFMRLKK